MLNNGQASDWAHDALVPIPQTQTRIGAPTLVADAASGRTFGHAQDGLAAREMVFLRGTVYGCIIQGNVVLRLICIL